MTQEFQWVCMSRGLAMKLYTPVVTTLLKQMINGLHFVGHDVNDFTTGCQPFLVAYAGNTHHMQALANASIGSNQLEQGKQNVTRRRLSSQKTSPTCVLR
jgi:hypothetical protein